MKLKKISLWAARIIVAIIFLQTLFFKFTSAPESIYIFSKIGIEPWGRYLSGVAELIASILLLSPLYFYGAILSLVIIIPAIFFHLTTLGIVVQGDGGLLFGMAVAIALLSIFIILTKKKK